MNVPVVRLGHSYHALLVFCRVPTTSLRYITVASRRQGLCIAGPVTTARYVLFAPD
jgi:hypothetical protein